MAEPDITQMRKFVSPEIIFGVGARLSVANYAKTFGAKKVLIVSDRGVKAAGWLGEVENLLSESDIDWVSFVDVSPNPRVEEVMKGLSFIWLSSAISSWRLGVAARWIAPRVLVLWPPMVNPFVSFRVWIPFLHRFLLDFYSYHIRYFS